MNKIVVKTIFYVLQAFTVECIILSSSTQEFLYISNLCRPTFIQLLFKKHRFATPSLKSKLEI